MFHTKTQNALALSYRESVDFFWGVLAESNCYNESHNLARYHYAKDTIWQGSRESDSVMAGSKPAAFPLG